MGEGQSDSGRPTVKKQSLRPVLIVSEDTVSEYSPALEHLLVGLADESIPAVLVCPPGWEAESVVSGTAEIVRHPALELPLMGHKNRQILAAKLEKFGPNLLHCLCESRELLTQKLARRLDLPYVLTVNSLQKRAGQLSISSKRLAKIIAPAESIAANIAKLYPRFAERVVQINVGTFVEERSVCFSESGRLASMVTAHPLRNAGDFENLFGAVRRLAIDGYEFMLVLIGNGRGERQLRRMLSEAGLTQIVSVIPKLQRWRAALAAGDIFIRPRASDAFDPFVLEAMSVGSAVASCKGGVDDLIIEDETAVVFEPNDELSIYSSLKQLLDRPELARQLAAQAQQHLRENHAVSKMIGDTLQSYREAVQ